MADALTFIREIRVFPPLAQTFTKNYQRPNAEASSGESAGFAERSGSGTEQSTLSRRWARSGQPCPPSEDLEDLEQSGKAFKSGEEKAGSIDNIGDSRYLAYGRLL